MRVIRASEIGSFLYCHKAWGFLISGEPSENQAEMTAGSEFHRQHGASVLGARILSSVGTILLIVALVVAVIAATLYLIQ